MEIPLHKSSAITSFEAKRSYVVSNSLWAAGLLAVSATWFGYLKIRHDNAPKRETVAEIIERKQRADELFKLWSEERGKRQLPLTSSSIKSVNR